MEGLAPQDGDLGPEQFAEVVGKNMGGHAHRNAVRPHHEEGRNLRGERDGLLVAPIVGVLHLRDLAVEHDIAGEGSESAFDVARGGGGVARVDVAEVPLAIDEESLVGEHHQSGADGGVPVWMVLHRVADDVGDFMEPPIIHDIQRMQYSPLHGFQAVIDMGDRPVLDDVGGVLHVVAGQHLGKLVVVLDRQARDGGQPVSRLVWRRFAGCVLDVGFCIFSHISLVSCPTNNVHMIVPISVGFKSGCA